MERRMLVMSHIINNTPFKSQFFAWIIDHPKQVIFYSLIVILCFGAGLKGIKKEPSVDAFVPTDHPAALARERAKSLFGIEDPIILGLVAAPGRSAFNVVNIEALQQIEQRIALLPNVKKQQIISLLSENHISSILGDLRVDPILQEGILSERIVQQAFDNIQSMPMLSGLLASERGDTLTMIIPVEDANHATDTYQQILAIAEQFEPQNSQIHISGVAAMNGRLAQMVNQDTRIFIPAAVLTALLILYIAFRSWRGVVGPLLVIAGSAVMAIGLMGWLDDRYYLITTALPVIIMAISIADSLHISTVYLRERSNHPELSARDALLDTLCRTYLPVTLTSITTIAGFVGLSIGSPMQPIAEFGWYAAVGVAAAWLLSITLLPAIIRLSHFAEHPKKSIPNYSRIDLIVISFTQASFNHPWRTSSSLVGLIVLFVYFALDANFDYERQRYFQDDEKVRIADVTLNQRLDGLNFLDVVVSSDAAGGLMTPGALDAMNILQQQLSQMPLVAKTSSIVDYISLMHSRLVDAPSGSLPSEENAPSQYMFLYEASGQPGDFDEEIDYGYQNALIRTQLTTDRFSQVLPTVDAFEQITRSWSHSHSGLSAAVSGRVAVNVGWMQLLVNSHFTGLGLAIAFVFCASILTFKALLPALLCLVPLLTGVLFTYAVMGYLGIDIAPATSMTAAISTGLGVDFAIHLMWQIRSGMRRGQNIRTVFSGRYIVIARACIYSALALGVALGVICLSSAPPLQWFGGLVATAAAGSLMGAIFILPAIYALKERLFTPNELMSKPL
jgi:predicted RND superfamily exporter protein